MSNKHILIFSHEFPPRGGGAGSVAYQYCLSLIKEGHLVTLLTRSQSHFPDELKDVNIIEVKYIPKIWFLPYFFRLKNIDLEKFDVIILNDIASGYIAGRFFKDKALEKCMPVLHGSEPENIFIAPSKWFRVVNFDKYYFKVLNKSKNIIAVSLYMKEKFLDETPFEDSKKIKVVYSGLSSNFFKETQIDCNHALDIQGREVILTVSRVEKMKGFLDMYTVFKKLLKIDKGYIWVIVGDGGFKKEFERLVGMDGMGSSIIFKGAVPRVELYKYYKCADVFWLLSKYKESFGLVYLEAQAYGCPVIGMNRYGVKEAVKPGKTGFLIDDANECVSIFLDKKYKRILKVDIVDFANQFDTKGICKCIKL